MTLIKKTIRRLERDPNLKAICGQYRVSTVPACSLFIAETLTRLNSRETVSGDLAETIFRTARDLAIQLHKPNANPA